MKRIIIAAMWLVLFCAGFTACGGGYYANIGISNGYPESYQMYYTPFFTYEPICGYNHAGLPLRCAGPVAPSYWRNDFWPRINYPFQQPRFDNRGRHHYK
jgi:hypothetical protein